MRAVVLGDAHLDVTVAPGIALRRGADVPADVSVAPGGQGANVAVRLARMGVDVRLLCALGDDPAGRLVRDSLALEGVELVALPAEATGAVVIIVDPEGERTMLSRRSPFAGRLGEVDLGRPDWLVVSGYLLLEDGAARVAAELAAAGERRALVGCTVPPDAVAAWRASAAALAPHLIVVNADEAALLNAAPAGTVLAVTRRDGARATLGSVAVDVLASPTRVVDTTGAGDALAASLVARLDRWPPTEALLREALAAAVSLASDVAGVRGAQARVGSEAPEAVVG